MTVGGVGGENSKENILLRERNYSLWTTEA